jgi:hypothetical protein
LASAGQQNLTQAGQAQGNLATTNQGLNLAQINALSTLGEQQRTLAQNKQLFPLSNLSTLSSMLRGYNVPLSTKTTAEMSPLSALASVGAGAAGLFSGTGTGGTGPSLFDNIKKSLGSNALTDTIFQPSGGQSTNYTGGASGGAADSTGTGAENFNANY